MLLLVLLISKIKVFVLQIFKLADSTLKGTVKDTLCCYKIYSVHFSFSLPQKFYFCLNPRPLEIPDALLFAWYLLGNGKGAW